MHVVGLDLAWGERKPTGVAVLDPDGRLVHISAATTDESIEAAISGFLDGPCVVAIDAPLIVRNPTGNRQCEKDLNRDFARFQAGAHPSNTGKPVFAVQPRGARIAERLGLDIAPTSRSRRRAIEVYPHPATIVLFGLDRTLKYKNKPGRDLSLLRSELLRLCDLLDGLSGAAPSLQLDSQAWTALRTAAETARRKSHLRVVEDQVDAVMCAYVGLLAVQRPAALTTYGDGENGYIVTPTLPT